MFSLAELRPVSTAVKGIVSKEQRRRLISCAKWQRRIYGRSVLSLGMTVRRVRDDVRRMDDGDVGKRNDNLGGRHQSVVVEIP